jgi:tRNA nucleotidyltransferase (CCA-adding enzyme)
MRVILTHEQADFDALASLYGASLLDEAAQPVLPRKMNRNLRSFLTLYGAELPFVDPRDLPQESIEAVTLVDTQSLVTLKGMGARTQVRVIDHHARREGLSADWQVQVDATGACTTLLVEALQDRAGTFSPVQATLLLLGIYEDTGSLTYSRTTPRDVRAAAWLLEQGASLKMAAGFLNSPLSPEQREVYEKLVRAVETHEIHGRRVVVACADAGGLSEEVSSLAHKLRDLLDPDALFVLVQTVEGVRLVARSTTDGIDVAAIASRFGGGGHDRAAAALIRAGDGDQSNVLESTRVKLIELLPGSVVPATTVAQIMSRRPKLLKPETSLAEAAKLMARSGFEGYPVLADGRVAGLLTRRAVDRALSHNLDLTAGSLMEAGEVSVAPGDSLQVLQTRMTDSGWGQVPVVDETGAVVGIVTRTDLLKTLAPYRGRPARRNLARRFEKAVPADRLALVKTVAAQAEQLNMAVYVVGGFVRDILLERPGLDFDIVVEGDAIALGRALVKQHGGRLTTHSRFGTAKWHLETHADIDLISARQEFYEHPSALPTVEHGSIKLDLHRRDFTINTLALRLDGGHYGELHDYWGGLADLEAGRVRVLHSLSFVDDPTRMLRAVRFEQRFGFAIEARTLQLMGEARELLGRLSGERARHEIDLILDEPQAVAMLDRLTDLDLFSHIHKDLSWDAAARGRVEAGLQAWPAVGSAADQTPGLVPLRRTLIYLLWLLDRAPAQVEELGSRLRFSAALTRALVAAVMLHADLPSLHDAPPSRWDARLEDVQPFVVRAVSFVADPDSRRALEMYLSDWRQLAPRTSGHDLQARGLPPGPAYQNILRRLRAAWLDGEVRDAEGEEKLLEVLMKDFQSQ